MDPLDWVREQGIVLQSASGPLPNLAEHIAGETIRGSVAHRFPAERLAAVDEVHTASGAHRTVEVPFPEWIPAQELAAAALLSVDEALALLPPCLR